MYYGNRIGDSTELHRTAVFVVPWCSIRSVRSVYWYSIRGVLTAWYIYCRCVCGGHGEQQHWEVVRWSVGCWRRDPGSEWREGGLSQSGPGDPPVDPVPISHHPGPSSSEDMFRGDYHTDRLKNHRANMEPNSLFKAVTELHLNCSISIFF